MSEFTPHPEAGKEVTLPAFGVIERGRVLAVDDLFAVVSDKFPISPGHTLIIPRRALKRFQEINAEEKLRLLDWVDWAQNRLLATLSPPPDAFNLGVNDGKAAGQTMPQFHFHVIPRHDGDVSDPRGGIRWVKPDKARYWADSPRPHQVKTIIEAIEKCSRCLADESLRDHIYEGCLPVPAFGDIRSPHIKVATVGLNPSSTEFFQTEGLKRRALRLPHLEDYSVESRERLTPDNIVNATQRRGNYFGNDCRAPHTWFAKLIALLNACDRNWNFETGQAVHVDIAACTTRTAWGKLPPMAAQAIIQNCSSHLTQTLALLPCDAWLLGDGKSVGDALAGDSADWRQLCDFRDSEGKVKPVRVRSGTSSAVGGGRRYCAWNIPVKHLNDQTLAKVGSWVSHLILR